MCSCGKNKVVTAQQMISTAGSSLPYLKFAYCAYKTQMENLFNQVGIKVTEATLPTLAKVYENGGDLRGDVKGIKFSVQERLNKIDTRKPENNSCAV